MVVSSHFVSPRPISYKAFQLETIVLWQIFNLLWFIDCFNHVLWLHFDCQKYISISCLNSWVSYAHGVKERKTSKGICVLRFTLIFLLLSIRIEWKALKVSDSDMGSFIISLEMCLSLGGDTNLCLIYEKKLIAVSIVKYGDVMNRGVEWSTLKLLFY